MILGASILQVPAIEKAKSMGLTVIAVDMNPDAVGFKKSSVQLIHQQFLKQRKDIRLTVL